MAVVSIDLAACRYRDIGIAILSGTPTSVSVELVPLGERGFSGAPEVRRLVEFCINLAAEAKADLVLIDGPQAWRASSSEFEYMRACERCTRTPGKTGLPGVVKPQPWTRMARFSVEVFDELQGADWPRLTEAWSGGRAAVETFPTHAWRTLGLMRPLPGKNRRIDLSDWARCVSDTFGVKWPRQPTHDELQAVVAGVGGLILEHEGLGACDVHGREPCREAESWREGYILSPKRPVNLRLHPSAGAKNQAGSTCFCGHRG